MVIVRRGGAAPPNGRGAAGTRKPAGTAGLPKGASVDSLLSAALEAARNPTCSEAEAAWNAAGGGGGLKLRQAVDAVGGMVFRNLVGRAERSWHSHGILKSLGSGRSRHLERELALWSCQDRRDPPVSGALYLELGSPGPVPAGGEAGDGEGCFTASSFIIPWVPDPADLLHMGVDEFEKVKAARKAFESGEPHAPDHLTVVGTDQELLRKLVWDLAVQSGYTEPSETYVLMDGSKAAAQFAWGLFPGSRRIVDFRELEIRVRRCGQAIFGTGPGAEPNGGGSRGDRARGWAVAALALAGDGATDRLAELVLSSARASGHAEARDLLRFLKTNEKFMNYPAFVGKGRYIGDNVLRRPPKGDLRGWTANGADGWSEKSVQAAAVLIDRLRSGRWDRDVAAPARERFGGKG
ncbi:MAG: hypothetical protein LBQ79_11045 [Deltaproteobacteria bacterium]|jgi:hypothetical protein|nr:hypothetical protein [Deltaproteobacteria bacterium]